MSNKNIWNFFIVGILFFSILDAQCRRGDKLRISNGVETKELDCRDATRLIYNEGWYPYSIEMKEMIDVLSLQAVLNNIMLPAIGS